VLPIVRKLAELSGELGIRCGIPIAQRSVCPVENELGLTELQEAGNNPKFIDRERLICLQRTYKCSERCCRENTFNGAKIGGGQSSCARFIPCGGQELLLAVPGSA